MAGQRDRLRFGEFELDTKASQLRRGSDVLNLTGQPLRILELLAKRAGEVVPREEIREALWPGDYNVDFEPAINVAIRKIREVLGESADAPVYLHTVRGKGYRFEIPEVTVVLPAVPEVMVTTLPDAPTKQWWIPDWRWAVLFVGVILLTALLANSRRLARGEKSISQFTASGLVSKVAVSADGSKIALIDIEQGELVLRVCDSETRQCKILVRNPGDVTKVVFSADMQYLFYGYFPPNGPFPGSNIIRIPVAGGAPVIVVEKTAWLQGVSRDGRRLLYLRRREAPNSESAFISGLYGEDERPVVRRLFTDRITVAAWSPDERTVACWWLSSNNSQHQHTLITVRLEDGAESVLSKGPWSAEFPRPDLQWVPDGSALLAAIGEPATEHRQIFRIDYPSGSVSRITNELASFRSLSITSDSQTLVTVKDDTAPQLWAVDPKNPAGARQITAGLPGYHSPAWTQKGILAMSGSDLYLVDPGTRQKRQVANLHPSDQRPYPTPDGREVYFESTRSGEHAVWKIGMDGRNATQVTYGSSGGRPKISPDGKWLAYTAFADDRIALWRSSIRGGLPVLINAKFALTEPDFSPDGKWIAASRPGTGTVYICPSEGTSPAKTVSMPGDAQWERFSWNPGGTAITYRSNVAGAGNLWNMPVDGGAPLQLTRFDSQEIHSFAWSPDGRLIIARSQPAADAVLIRNFLQ